MANIAQNITDLIGNTPLLQLNAYARFNAVNANIVAKLEYFNPLGSVKDRVAYAMITQAEEKGLITKNTTIIEPTSGNTGVGLAFVAASKGYKLILVMPDTMSMERRAIVTALGAKLVLTPGAQGMAGAVQEAEALAAKIPSSFNPQQFNNPTNPQIHRESTALELLADTDHQIAAFVGGVGTGGTISGIGSVLKAQIDGVHVVAVEPADSPVLSGGVAGPHGIQGIGAGFVPAIYDKSVVDELICVQTQDAYEASRAVARQEGLLVGISSGAALHAAVQIARRPEFEGKNIVVLLPDSGERYLSTPLYEKPII